MSPRQKSLSELIDDALAAKEEDRLSAIETLLIADELKKLDNNALKKKLEDAYKHSILLFAQEIHELNKFIVSQLDNIDNCDEKNIPRTHTNIIIAAENLVDFVARDIITEPNFAKRTQILKRYIAVTQILLAFNDFHGACVLTTALNSRSVSALKSCFVRLTKEESEKLKYFLDLTLKDKAWEKMLGCLKMKSHMVPNLPGLKGKFIRAKEGKNAHEMETEHLQETGKLKKPARTPEPATAASPLYLQQLNDCIANLAKAAKKDYSELTEFQKILLPINLEKPLLTAIPSVVNIEQLCDTANSYESECIPQQMSLLVNERDAAVKQLIAHKLANTAKDNEAKRNMLIADIESNCCGEVKPSYKDQIENINAYLASMAEKSVKPGNIFGEFIRTVRRREDKTSDKTQLFHSTLSDLKDILEKIDILNHKMNRLRSGSTSSALTNSGSHISRSRGSALMRTGHPGTPENRSRHNSTISNRSNRSSFAEETGLPVSESSNFNSQSAPSGGEKKASQLISIPLKIPEPAKEPLAVSPTQANTKTSASPVSSTKQVIASLPANGVAKLERKEKQEEKKIARTESLIMRRPPQEESPRKKPAATQNHSSLSILATLRGSEHKHLTKVTSDRHLERVSKNKEGKKPHRQKSDRSLGTNMGRSTSSPKVSAKEDREPRHASPRKP